MCDSLKVKNEYASIINVLIYRWIRSSCHATREQSQRSVIQSFVDCICDCIWTKFYSLELFQFRSTFKHFSLKHLAKKPATFYWKLTTVKKTFVQVKKKPRLYSIYWWNKEKNTEMDFLKISRTPGEQKISRKS